MRFKPELDTKQIPALMTQAAGIAPWGWWKKRLDAFSAQERENSLLSDYFDEKYPLERTYGLVHAHYRATGRYPNIDVGNYELFSFLGSLILVHQGLSEKGRRRLKASVRDGLQDAKGLAPQAAELRTAIHLMLQGYDIEFTDLESSARFDLLASKGDVRIEVDCKAPSGDVGRQIHGQRFRSLAGQLMPVLTKIVDDGQNYLIRVVIPSNLYGDRAYEQRLIKQIQTVLQNTVVGKVSSPIGDVSIEPFNAVDSPFNRHGPISAEALAEFLQERFSLLNVNAATRWFPGKGAVIFVIQSSRPDNVADGICRQLKWSANSQFSGSRPAMLCVQLLDVSARQLRNLASATPNGLMKIATDLFSNSRPHLAGVSFVALEKALTQRQFEFGDLRRTSYQDVGAAYVFSNPKHPAANVIDAIFRRHGGME